MSTQSFDGDETYYTATFTITYPGGQTEKISYGVWTDIKRAKSYIKVTLNHQQRVDDWEKNGGVYDPNGAFGRSQGYPRPINDASSFLTWRAKGARYTEAEVNKIIVSNTPEPDTKVVY